MRSLRRSCWTEEVQIASSFLPTPHSLGEPITRITWYGVTPPRSSFAREEYLKKEGGKRLKKHRVKMRFLQTKEMKNGANHPPLDIIEGESGHNNYPRL